MSGRSRDRPLLPAHRPLKVHSGPRPWASGPAAVREGTFPTGTLALIDRLVDTRPFVYDAATSPVLLCAARGSHRLAEQMTMKTAPLASRLAVWPVRGRRRRRLPTPLAVPGSVSRCGPGERSRAILLQFAEMLNDGRVHGGSVDGLRAHAEQRATSERAFADLAGR